MSLRCALVALCLSACNVTSANTTGGADLPDRGACPRGIAVVSSDYQSSEIALLAADGEVASSAFLSSASTQASSLAAPLSGDIVVASSPTRPNELTIVDRFGTNVLTFVDAETALVRAQLPVGTGFEANAQDYVAQSLHQAFVPRLGDNASPGHESFDAGSDLLVIDPSLPAITGSVPMPRQAGYFPTPVAATLSGDDVLVTLQHARPNFSAMADGEIVAVRTSDLSVRYRLRLNGLKNCGRVEIAPSGKVLAVACEAYVDRKGAVADPSASGVVLLDATEDPPTELKRLLAVDVFQGSIQSSLAFASEHVVLVKTQTAQGGEQDNQLFALDVESGKATLLATAARSATGAGFGIAFGGMRCDAACGDPCVVADASRGKLLRFGVDHDVLSAWDDVETQGAGLPPTGVTAFW